MSGPHPKDREALDALASAGWSEDDRECAATALLCAASGDAGHWPTAAGWLASTTHALAEAATLADAQIRDLLEEREELLTEIRRLRMGNHPAGRALRTLPQERLSHLPDFVDDSHLSLHQEDP